MQGNGLNQADWLGLERIVPGYGGEGRAGMDISGLDGVVDDLGVTGAGNGEAFVAEDTAGVCVERSLGAVDEWDISFGDLLALAEAAAGNPGSAGHVGAGGGSNFGVHSNCTAGNGGLSVPNRFTYDLNFPPEAVSDVATPQFAPLTPGKAGRAENDGVSEAQNLKYANGNEVGTLEVDASQFQGPSQPDDNEELELSKTPQQKPKRRKHRPKVVRECKAKQTPKPAMTPKTSGSAENPTGKRKYVRKANKPAAPQAQENIESAYPQDENSCRRALKFCTQDENSTQRPISDLYSESRVQNFCNEAMMIRSKSRAQISQGIESRVQNTQPGIVYDLTCSEVLENCDQVNVYEDIVKTAMNTQSASRSPYDPTCSTSAVLTVEEEQARRSKRKSSSVIEASNENRNGVQFNTLQFYASLMHFPNIYKKGRSEKGQTSIISNTSSCSTAMQPPTTCQRDHVKESFAPKVNCWTQVHDLPLQPTYSAKQGLVVGDTRRVENSKRKRGGHRKVTTWKDHIDAVTEQFKYLDINRESNTNRALYQERNTLVPYDQDQNALINNRSDGTIVPFQGAFSPIRKQRPRPKVELDDETNKVWRLLLENINNEGINGTDEEKRRWWEEERRVFRGRADSFIARMHLVQGDRRFSRWKGSVVDSVVGVFLTQNVSDHLSSSAYMALAARYPLKTERDHNPMEEACMQDSEQTIEWMKKMSTQRVSDQSSMTLHDSEHNEEKQVVNSLIDKAKCSALNCNESDLERYHKSATRTETSSFAPNRRGANDVASPQNSLNSSQNTVESSIAQTATNSEAEELGNRLEPTFTQLLKIAGASMLHEVSSHRSVNPPCGENCKETHSTSEQSTLTGESGSQGTVQNPLTVLESSKSCSENNQRSDLQGNENVIIQSQNWFVGDSNADTLAQEQNKKVQQTLNLPNLSGETLDVTESTISGSYNQRNTQQKAEEDKALKDINSAKQKSRRVGREINNEIDWDTLRREAEANGKKRERTPNTMDSLDWEAVRCADVNDIAETIKERGMNNMLAERIKAFLNRLVKDHGSIDLEWLRDLSPDKAKEYLLSVRGLGLKSVECVRLLTLHHLAFPVDTNVGRIAVRLGWVPLQPLPESLQLHLLELYPVLESIQRYLWPRLCKLEQKQLYELHYQMITFGKVFCTKSKPNCNACPMRGECRHFASAFASARLALPAPEEKSIVPATEKTANLDNGVHSNGLPLPLPQAIQQLEGSMQLGANLGVGKKSVVGSCEPIIEEPASPEPENNQDLERDIEDALYDDPDEIPTIKLNIKEFTQNLQNYMEKNMELQEGEMSKALVAITSEAASLPMPRLKNVSRLRTEHQVYELPDSHPLLEGRDNREPDDPCSYLLAIWTPGETPNSIQPPEGGCNYQYQESGKLCDQKTCFTCSSIREANSQMVRGTLLIPCRTAMRGSFPLNGTYFQVNEVFADHDSSLNPIDVPRSWIWNLPRRTVYFGTSVPSIFKGLPTEGIQHCFWRGYVCVRGFDYKTRAPRPLMARLHFPASKLPRSKGRTVDE